MLVLNDQQYISCDYIYYILYKGDVHLALYEGQTRYVIFRMVGLSFSGCLAGGLALLNSSVFAANLS